MYKSAVKDIKTNNKLQYIDYSQKEKTNLQTKLLFLCSVLLTDSR